MAMKFQKMLVCSALVVGFVCLSFGGPNAGAIPAEGQKIMIAGPSPISIGIGKEIARKGGNAIDVAVAVAFSMAVTQPYFASLGGGGFAMIKMSKQTEVLDFREMAPHAASPDLYKGKGADSSIDGALAVGVPGVPAGLWALHKKYGNLHWNVLLLPAIDLAIKGFEVSGEWSQTTFENQKRFNPTGQAVFFKKNGVRYLPGDILKQPDLARLLREMSNRGIVPFYEGMAARDIAKTLQAKGGILTYEDMKNYKVRWLEPLRTDFMGYQISLMPPPSSGGVVLTQALKMIELSSLKNKKPMSIDELHTLGEILKLSFRGRSLLGDPDFVKNPLNQLLSDSAIHENFKHFKADKSYEPDPASKAAQTHESKQTTHFSVMDDKGHAVAITMTLNGDYGSGMVSEKFGVALNNEMDDFTTQPGQPNMFGLIQGDANKVEPGKRPLSSMSPTIVEKNGELVMAVGSPGGPRIISAVLQVLYRSLVNGFDMDHAIQAGRVHHQYLPNILYIEPFRFSPEILEGLKARGHKVEESDVALVYGIRKRADGLLEGAFDSRAEGAAGGF
jgi:gamma-glutamyltranspeptidase/glutathione hydrolase